MKRFSLLRIEFLALAMLGCGQGSSGTRQQAETSTDGPSRESVGVTTLFQPMVATSQLLRGMVDSLRGVKPETRKIGLVSLLPGMDEGERSYLVLAVAHGPGYGSSPTTKSEEIYALFWVDGALARPTRLLDTFPTGRRDDWDVWLQRSWSGTIVICAEGATYGDEPMRRTVLLDSNAVATVRIDVTRERTPATWNAAGGCSSTGPKGGD